MEEIIKKNPSIAIEMLEYLSKTIRLLSDQLSDTIFLGADKKIAKLILNKYSLENIENIQLTHKDIAELIRVSRVTVSKILKTFKENKFIDTKYRYIKLLDAENLENYLINV